MRTILLLTVAVAIGATPAAAQRVRQGNRAALGAAIGAVAGLTAGAVIGAQRYAGKPKSPGACYDLPQIYLCTRPVLSTLEWFDGAMRGAAIGGLLGAAAGTIIGRAIPAWKDRIEITPLGGVTVRF